MHLLAHFLAQLQQPVEPKSSGPSAMSSVQTPTRRGEWLSSLVSGGNATPAWLRDVTRRSLRRGDPRLTKLAATRDDGTSLGFPDGLATLAESSTRTRTLILRS